MSISQGEVNLTKENFMDVMNSMHTNDGMFLNAECLFVEYHDIIKMPWYVMMSVIHQNKQMQPLIDLIKISGLDSVGLMEWYCNRLNRNPLVELASAPLDKVDYDMILDTVMKSSSIFYEVDTELNAVAAIKLALQQGIVKQVIVYSDEKNPIVEQDVMRIFNNNKKVKVFLGNIEKVLERMPTDSSYMVSDFNKVITIAECGKLDYASLILPYDYSYNFIIDENGAKKPIVDFTYLGKDHLFKMGYFNACYM